MKWKYTVCSITLLYSSTFYILFLPFFVLEIFKFKHDKVFVRDSASISKFEWFEQPWREHQQKTFVKLSRFWLLRGWQGPSESIKKENSWWKYFFQILLNKVLKICEKWYLLMQKRIKTKRNKRSGGYFLQIFIRSIFKTWNAM